MCRVRADTYSKSKYSSVISQAGGWEWFQRLLGALHGIAQKHSTSIANVASRWVLDQPQARLSSHTTAIARHPGEISVSKGLRWVLDQPQARLLHRAMPSASPREHEREEGLLMKQPYVECASRHP